MMTRSCSVLIFAALLALLVGCSGGMESPSPVAPLTSGDTAELIGAGSSAEGGHVLWGLWQVILDPETGKIDIARLRHAEFHLNATRLIQPPYREGLRVTFNDFRLAAGWADVNATLTHPFPNSNLRGFDVRGIVMGAGNTVNARGDPTLVYTAPDGLRLENADGYTRWWNAQEFTTEGLYGFLPGEIGFKTFVPLTTLNPYKYFADPLSATDSVVPEVNVSSRGTFSTDTTPPRLTRNYVLQFPIKGPRPDWRFQYAIDASWAPPTGDSPRPKPVGDFPLEANCPEAFHIAVSTGGTTAYYMDETDFGGSLTLAIEVFDWGAVLNPDGIDGEIESIRIESETLFDNVINVPVNATPGSQETSGVYSITVPSVHPTWFEGQEVLITVRSQSPATYEPPVGDPACPVDAHLAAYALVEIPISSTNPQATAIQVKTPQGGEKWTVWSNRAIEWSWTGDIPTVDIFLSTDGGTTYPHKLNPSPIINSGLWTWNDIPSGYITTKARIRVESVAEPEIRGESNANFSILPSAPFIMIERPNGGERWGVGSVQTIGWHWAGDIPTVDIELSLDGGANYNIPLAENCPNTGELVVSPVGNWPSQQARMRVTSSDDPGLFDESDDDFAIVTCDPDNDPPETSIEMVEYWWPPHTVMLWVTGTDNCTDPENITFEWCSYRNGEPVEPWTPAQGPMIIIGKLKRGSWTIHVRAVDEVGNKDPSPDSVTFEM